METVITRDSDILREYIAALDARERGLSPFARLAATVKLARLRRELESAGLETTDEDLSSLRREIDERLHRSFTRKFEAKSWGARISVFLMLVLGQQLALLLVLLGTLLYINVVPVPNWWNPALPREEPIFLYTYIFFFFFTTPMLALAVLFGGRYFRSWRRTVPATLVILALSVLGTWLVLRGTPNPVQNQKEASLRVFAESRGTSQKDYLQWLNSEPNALLREPKFRRDYEQFLRNGPGRWVTSRFDAKDDAAWQPRRDEKDVVQILNGYLDGGQDPQALREWLTYYFDRNRIFSEDRVEQEADAITGEANQQFLGIWQVEPFLKERDERMYRAYLGGVNKWMKIFGLVNLALFTLVFLAIYVTGPALSFWERISVRGRPRRSAQLGYDAEPRPVAQSRASRLRERYYSFPERGEITTPPFFETPFLILSRVHRSFVRFAVFMAISVFGFWALVYFADLAAGNENAPSVVALMRSNLLFGGSPDRPADAAGLLVSANADGPQEDLSLLSLTDEQLDALTRSGQLSPRRREAILLVRLLELEKKMGDTEYENSKEFKEQSRIIAEQRNEIGLLRSLTAQLEQTTSGLPDQIAAVGSQANAAEARAGEMLGEVTTAKQKAEGVDQVRAKLTEVETRATRASEQVGKVEDQASVLATRTEALEKEIDRRAGQIEARTEELGERTASLQEREDRVNRLQRVAFAAIIVNLQSNVDEFDRRTQSAISRFFNSSELRQDADRLRERMSQLAAELSQINTEQAKEFAAKLEELAKRVEEIAGRIK